MAVKWKDLRVWLWPLLRQEKWDLLLYLLLEVSALIAGLFFIYSSKKAIDIALSEDTEAMYWSLVWVVLSILGTFVFRTVASWVNQRCKNRMLMALQNNIIRIQANAVWKVSHKRQAGDIQMRIQEDATEVTTMLVSSGPQVLITCLSLMASLGFMWVMDARLALLILGLSPLFILSKFYYKRLRALNAAIKEEQGLLSNTIQENLKFRILVRAMAIGAERQALIDQKQAVIYKLKNSLLNFSLRSQSLVRLLVQVGFLVTFCWGVYHIHLGVITFGTMTAFLQLVSRIQSPLVQIMSFVPSFIRFRTAADRVHELLQEEVEVPVAAKHLPDLEGLVIEDLYFKYEDRDVIAGLNLEVKRGDSIAILGNSGKGKTTLTRLLLALLRADCGQIKLYTGHGEELLDKAHRINIAYVPQGEKIFRGTVRENLTMAASDVSDARIAEVIYLSCAEFVYELPQGLDTVISDAGLGLSEGQAHRIALARALMRPSPIWLFDELTAALDRSTADRLMDRLLAAATDKMLFFVTHDPILAARCSHQIYL